MTQDDFKYMMQDLYRLYFGVKCTYREILQNEDAYYKFKAVVRQYLIREVARIKLRIPAVKKDLFGREHKIFKEEIWKVDDLMALTAHQKQFRGIVLSELQIPKIKLREFAV